VSFLANSGGIYTEAVSKFVDLIARVTYTDKYDLKVAKVGPLESRLE